MITNNKPHVIGMGFINQADGQSVSAVNNTHIRRPSAKYLYKRRDSLPYLTETISDAAFIKSKAAADEHLKRMGLTPVWSKDDLERERRIQINNYLDLLYKIGQENE